MERSTQHTSKGASLILDNPKDEDEARKQVHDKFLIALKQMAREEDIQQQAILVADTYGYEAQSRQCIEEMAELTQAINKLWRKENYGSGMEIAEARLNVIEELADVKIMIMQMEHLLDAREDTGPMMIQKLYRQIARIE